LSQRNTPSQKSPPGLTGEYLPRKELWDIYRGTLPRGAISGYLTHNMGEKRVKEVGVEIVGRWDYHECFLSL